MRVQAPANPGAADTALHAQSAHGHCAMASCRHPPSGPATRPTPIGIAKRALIPVAGLVMAQTAIAVCLAVLLLQSTPLQDCTVLCDCKCDCELERPHEALTVAVAPAATAVPTRPTAGVDQPDAGAVAHLSLDINLSSRRKRPSHAVDASPPHTSAHVHVFQARTIDRHNQHGRRSTGQHSHVSPLHSLSSRFKSRLRARGLTAAPRRSRIAAKDGNSACQFDHQAKAVMLDFFSAMHGQDWQDCSMPWSYNAPMVSWCYVEVTNYTSECEINIDLEYIDGLSGTIPASLGSLSRLYSLVIISEHLSGTIPPELGNLPILDSLDVESTVMTGTIPPELGNVSSLTSIVLNFNNLISGSVPSPLFQLSQLQYLDLSSNELLSGTLPSLSNLQQLITLSLASAISGTIPASLVTLSRLKHLFLAGLAISGTIPFNLGNMSQLEDIFIGQNPYLSGVIPALACDPPLLYELSIIENPLLSGTFPALDKCAQLMGIYIQGQPLISGTIPSIINTLSQLETLHVFSMDRLSGTLPASFANLPFLTTLYMYANPLMSGTLPSSLSNTSLIYAYLNSNPLLSGTIPSELDQLPELTSLQLFSNPRLSGTLPSSLGNASQLTELDVFANPLLSGTIPASLCALTSLTVLKLNSNPRLSGTIPPQCGALPALEFLYLYSCPRLSGTIPASFGLLSQVIEIRLQSNKRLSGTLPPSLALIRHLLLLDLSDLPLLSGPIPSFNGSYLRVLKLSGNLSGEWPLRPMGHLMVLHITKSQLSGSIPENICMSAKLVELDLSSNRLSGYLPTCMKNMTQLRFLRVSSNRLSGPFARVLPPQLHAAFLDGNPFRFSDSDCLDPLVSNLKILDLSHTTLNTAFLYAFPCYMTYELEVLRLPGSQLSGVFDKAITAGPQCSKLAGILASVVGVSPSSLSSLDISNNTISGTMDMSMECCFCLLQLSIWSMLPYLVSISLSHTDVDVYGLPLTLRTLQLRHTRELSTTALKQLLSSPILEQADLQGTDVQPAVLQSVAALYLAGTQAITFPAAAATCPHWQTTVSRGVINADLGFFGYRQCNCTQPTWYWRADDRICRPCPSRGRLLCDPSVLRPVHTVLPNYYPLFTRSCANTSMQCLPAAKLVPCLSDGICAVPGPDHPTPDQPELITGYYCAVGHNPRSRLCSMCLQDYFLYGHNCNECHTWQRAVIPLLLLVCLGGYLYFLRRRLDSTSATFSSRSSMDGNFTSTTVAFTSLLIVFYWLQLIYITTTEGVQATSAAHGHVFGWLQSVAMFHPWGIDCLVPSIQRYHLEMILTMPISLTLIVCLCLSALHMLRPSPRSLQFTLVFGFQQTWELLYLPVCAVAVQSLSCHHSDGESFLEHVPYRDCPESLTVLTIITLVYFVSGYPLIDIYGRYRKARQPSCPLQGSREPLQAALHLSQQRIRLWWWEPLALRLRSVYVAVVVYSLPLHHPLIPLLIYVALLLNLLAQLYLFPYTDAVNNRLSVVTLTSLLVIYLCSMIDDNEYSPASRRIAIILTFSLTLLYILSALIPEAARTVLQYVSKFLHVDLDSGADSDGDNDSDAGALKADADYMAVVD